MQATIPRIEALMHQTETFLLACPQEIRLHRPAPGKWSKQEILGHLVDSAVNNLKRFTDAQLAIGAYQVVRYNQDALVQLNAYQQADLRELLTLWMALNRQILVVVEALSPEGQARPVLLPDGTPTSLGWLIRDYTDHMFHHVRQITAPLA